MRGDVLLKVFPVYFQNLFEIENLSQHIYDLISQDLIICFQIHQLQKTFHGFSPLISFGILLPVIRLLQATMMIVYHLLPV